MRFLTPLILAAGLTMSLMAQAPAPVTFQDLLGGLKDPTRWLTFSGDYTGQRFTRLNQIVEREDTVSIRGMVKAVPHLVRIVK